MYTFRIIPFLAADAVVTNDEENSETSRPTVRPFTVPSGSGILIFATYIIFYYLLWF